jgi:hypothetical protein
MDPPPTLSNIVIIGNMDNHVKITWEGTAKYLDSKCCYKNCSKLTFRTASFLKLDSMQ